MIAALIVASAVACVPSSEDRPAAAAPSPPFGDAARGQALAIDFECARCHEHSALARPPLERECVGCHREILAGRYDASTDDLARWQSHLTSLPAAPSLDTARRLRPEAIASFLAEPHDLRPHLPATMPRLALTARDTRDLAAWLVRDRTSDTEPGSVSHDRPTSGQPSDTEPGSVSSVARGLLSRRGCMSCHAFTGVAAIEVRAPAVAITRDGVVLAPDLRWARERMTPEAIVEWILAPAPPMPRLVSSRAEAEAMAQYLVDAELAPPRATPSAFAARLPPLARRVTFDEVNEAVFRRTCWHCHADPTYAYGDGGPGNTGGFGFAPRGLSFADHPSVLSGARGDDGEPRSIFRPTSLPHGGHAPYVVAALLARREEEAGRPVAGVRGMPLGLPALGLEQIQLVESWIVSGRPE